MVFELNKLYYMDCMEAMKYIPDKYFDLAIVDPPYFEAYKSERYPGAEISTTGVKRNRFKISHWEVPRQQYFDELQRLSTHQIIWGINYFDIQNIGHGRIVWDKKNDSSSFSKCEIAYCSMHHSIQIFRYMWNGMLQEDMKKKEKRIHPTQKPVALYKWLLKNYASEGDKILDTHVGSGSSLIACHDMGFDFLGFEIDEEYFRKASERLLEHCAQLRFAL